MKFSHTLFVSTALTVVPIASQAWEGWYGGLKVGYAHTSVEGKSATDVPPGHRGKKQSRGGFMGGAYLGYDHPVAERWVFGEGFGIDYISGKVEFTDELKGENPNAGQVVGQSTFQPFLTFSLFGRFGYKIFDHLLAYAKLAASLTSANMAMTRTAPESVAEKSSGRLWNISPAVGVEGEIKDRWRWNLEGGYQFTVSMYGHKGESTKKPGTGFITVGVSYALGE